MIPSLSGSSKLLIAGAAVLLATSCGSTAPQPTANEPTPSGMSPGKDSAPRPHGSQPGSGHGKQGGGKKEPKSGGAGGSGSPSSGSAPGTSGGGAGAPTGGSGSTGSKGGGGTGGSSNPAGGTHAAAAGRWYPKAGDYIYSQQGFEEFCTTTCDRDKLPPRQRISASYGSRSNSAAVVVTEARASGDRLVRTTTRYTNRVADVLEVHLEYSYEGFRFSKTYRPSPPVDSLVFPLRPGDSWSGSWKGDVSGHYSANVLDRDSVGGTDALRLRTATRFRGDLKGKANVTLWVRPGDGTVLRTAGNLTVDMGIGTYRSGFATTLDSGPG